MPLFVPSTPGGELTKRILNIKNLNDQGWNVRFKIVERRGVNSGGKVEAGERCRRRNCFQCQTDEGGDCWREGVTYSLVCEEWGAEYFGESGRNGFTRGGEHLMNKEAPKSREK